MLLGIQPTGWTNDDFQEIGNDTPFQQILEETADAGFAGGSTGHNYPTHLPSLLKRPRAETADRRHVGGDPIYRRRGSEAAFREFTDQVAFLEAVGGRMLWWPSWPGP